MAGITTDDLLRRLADTCQLSALVESYAVENSDVDTLSVRVFLTDHTFINVFYNLATNKVAFAWIRENKRLYGKDNAKHGWHAHPFDAPENHQPCEAIDFESFLRSRSPLHPNQF
jgi:hypothetical protein